MTGHGQASLKNDTHTVEVEIRAVNNRFLKVSTKLSDLISSLESDIENEVRLQVKRGSVSVSVRVSGIASSEAPLVNQPVLQRYVNEAKVAATATGTDLHLNWGDMLQLPGVLTPARSECDESLSLLVLEACRVALKDLQAMRACEGKAMQEKFQEYLQTLRELRSSIDLRAPVVVTEYQAKLEQRVRNIFESRGVEIENMDLIREVTLFSDRADIAEELTRLASHLDQFERAIEAPESQGRRLDFLLQELGRETNTIGSKANDAQISKDVVTQKTVLEQIRELVQNVE